jgi:CubicO group peptidase (beta-lactamase class C family)
MPGAVALVERGGETLCLVAVGDAQIVPTREPLGVDTAFDLASLTKPLATAALALLLERRLGLAPDLPARALVPELAALDLDGITLSRLLRHESGLAAWHPLYAAAEDVAGYLRGIRALPLASRPGSAVLYSDLGYIVAGEMVARAAGAGIDVLFNELLATPLGLGACFRPAPPMARRAAATEVGQEYERALAGEAGAGYLGFREGTIRGEVHDHNAWVAGGVLGSAGLFGGARDLQRLGRELLGEGSGALPTPVLSRLRRPGALADGEARSEGFALNTGGTGSCGPALDEDAFGHTGFTGTSIWIEPRRRGIYILLTNRVHPRVQSVDIRALRREFHRLAAAL